MFGTAMHRWMETGVVTEAVEKKLLLSGMTDEERWRWWPSEGAHEFTFAVHVASAALVLRDMGDFNLTDDEWKAAFDRREYLTGTIDYLDGIWVDDLKTGQCPDVETSGQLRSYALVPWLLRGRPRSYRGLVSITHYPRYPLATPPSRYWATVTGAQLEMHLDALADALSSNDPNNTNPTATGCKYCACAPHCPAWDGASA